MTQETKRSSDLVKKVITGGLLAATLGVGYLTYEGVKNSYQDIEKSKKIERNSESQNSNDYFQARFENIKNSYN